MFVAVLAIGVRGATLREQQDNYVEKEINVNMTVKEVEEILGGDPSLPRLTRGEILSLIGSYKKLYNTTYGTIRTSPYILFSVSLYL